VVAYASQATPKQIADIMTVVNRWFERLSNRQFVVAAASCFLVLSCVVAGCVNLLADGHADFISTVTFGVLFTVIFTIYSARRRWR